MAGAGWPRLRGESQGRIPGPATLPRVLPLNFTFTEAFGCPWRCCLHGSGLDSSRGLHGGSPGSGRPLLPPPQPGLSAARGPSIFQRRRPRRGEDGRTSVLLTQAEPSQTQRPPWLRAALLCGPPCCRVSVQNRADSQACSVEQTPAATTSSDLQRACPPSWCSTPHLGGHKASQEAGARGSAPIPLEQGCAQREDTQAGERPPGPQGASLTACLPGFLTAPTPAPFSPGSAEPGGSPRGGAPSQLCCLESTSRRMVGR